MFDCGVGYTHIINKYKFRQFWENDNQCQIKKQTLNT
jgi:hypothetical protein